MRMTPTLTKPTPDVDAANATTATPVKLPVRVKRWWIASLVLLVAATALFTWLIPRDDLYPINYPYSRNSSGTAALFETLADHGIQVNYAMNTRRLPAIDADTTVVILPSSITLFDGDISEELRHAGRVVVTEDAVFDGLWSIPLRTQFGFSSDSTLTTTATPTDQFCLSLRGLARHVTGFSAAIIDHGEGSTPDCQLQAEDETTETKAPAAFLAAWKATAQHPELVHLASVEPLRNESILDADNAALLLTLLGSKPKLLVIYDLNEEPSHSYRGVWMFLPRWVLPTVWLLGGATVALSIWRGRRFGRVAYEQLPIAISARESTDSLGRMLQRSGDCQHTAAALQARARADLTAALRLPATVSPENLVSAVVHQLAGAGRAASATEIYELLYAPFNGSARNLHGWANRLVALTKEVTDESQRN